MESSLHACWYPIEKAAWQSAISKRFKVSPSLELYVSRVLFATPALGHVIGLTARRRWRRLSGLLFDPYRPELHYMRGPGPKWREKHARGSVQGA
jgi:hypothetical protein